MVVRKKKSRTKKRTRGREESGKRRTSSPSFGKRWRNSQKPYGKAPFLEVSQHAYGIKVSGVKYVEARKEDFWIVEGVIKFGRSKEGYSDIDPDKRFRRLGPGDAFAWLVKLSNDAGPGDAKNFVAVASGEEFEDVDEDMLKGACAKDSPIRGTYLSARVTEVETKAGGIFTAVDWELIGDADDFETWKDEQPTPGKRRKKKKKTEDEDEPKRQRRKKKRPAEDEEEPKRPRRKKKRTAKRKKRFT